MPNGLTTSRLDFLLPPLGHDPGVEAHARRLLTEKRRYFERLFKVANTAWGSWNPDHDPFAMGGLPDCLIRAREEMVLELARAASRVTFVRARYHKARQAVIKLAARARLPKVVGWRVSTPTIVAALGSTLLAALMAWADREAERARRFAEGYLARQREAAEASTAAGIAAGVAELLGSLLLMLDSARAAFARVVEPLTRRVLAAGGQTAVFAPLT